MATDASLLELVSRVDDAAATLARDLRSADARAFAFALPLYGDDGTVPPFIEVESLQGRRAIDACADALCRFARAADQVPTTAWRLPGIVFCLDDLEGEVHELNARKDALRRGIAEAAPAALDRRALVKRLCPGRSMLQMYRHAHVASAAVMRAGFTWSPTTAGTTTLTVEAAAAFIEERLAAGAFRGPDQRAAFERAWERLGTLGANARILRRREVAPHPRVTLFEGRGKDAPKRMHHANLPVFVFGREPFAITALKDFDVNRRRKRRSDATSPTPLLAPLGLFVAERVDD